MANQETKQMVVRSKPTRLAYNLDAKEFGIGASKWGVLCDMIYPNAKSPEIIMKALQYCKDRNLDIMKRPVHIVPIWSSEKKAQVESIWPGISELRKTAFRTNQFAGLEQTLWGPDITKTFKKDGGVPQEVTFPEWARIDCWRIVQGERVLWAGPTVYWLETYAKAGKGDMPNSMWLQRTRGQLEKCAEAATYRRVFPEEIGSEYTVEEMEGQVWAGSGPIIENEPEPDAPKRPDKKEPVDYRQMGADARNNDIDSGDAPDHMNPDEYKQWMAGWKAVDAEMTKKADAKADNHVDEETGEITESKQPDMLGGDDSTEADLAAGEIFDDPDASKIDALWFHATGNKTAYSDADAVIARCEKWQKENK